MLTPSAAAPKPRGARCACRPGSLLHTLCCRRGCCLDSASAPVHRCVSGWSSSGRDTDVAAAAPGLVMPHLAPFAERSPGGDCNGVMGSAQAAGTGSFPPAGEDFSVQGSEMFQGFLGGMNIHTATGVSLRCKSTLTAPPPCTVQSCCWGFYIHTCFCCYSNWSVSIIH